MKALARIVTTFKPEIPDPRGQAIMSGLKAAGHEGILDVKLGKEFEVELEVENKEQAHEVVGRMCQELLAHRVTDDYTFTVEFPPPPPPNLDDLIKELEEDIDKIKEPRLHVLLVLCETKELSDFECSFFAALLSRYQKNGKLDEMLKAETNLEVIERFQKVINRIFGRANKCIFKNEEGGAAAYMFMKMVEVEPTRDKL